MSKLRFSERFENKKMADHCLSFVPYPCAVGAQGNLYTATISDILRVPSDL
jgi:hypothetical protein